ncbi:DNA-binding transcriptional regulator, LysR family [Prauserella aidingensis]|uniref:LysR family transcriptional regulator n=1 Tax=Prauserella aidingensis TaxID=387890 RepID=UPI0020A5D1FB|nr:LysR family transcriptional regulator [Prauserella aidingensis]MCP2253914.1 DNA-binding transcriptional regulator, LysR family [Prauserella aidingensis]
MAEFTVPALRVVHAVVGTGSFTAAAELLGYTQSAISRQVSAAEAAAGLPLFVRKARGVEATRAGEAVARRAAAVLAELDAAGRELAALSDTVAEQVTIGAFPTATWSLVPAAMAALRDEHPGLVTELHEASTPALVRQVRTGGVDVGVIAVGQGLPAYDLDGLYTERLTTGGSGVVAVPREHRLAGRTSVTVDDLAGEAWITGTGQRGEPQFGAWPTLPQPRIAYRIHNWNARLGFVAAGLGITTVPELAVAGLPAEVATVGVQDPSWSGRTALAVAAPELTAGQRAVMAALRDAATGDG